MPELIFSVQKAEAVKFAIAPQLAFTLRIENMAREEPVQTVALRCQIMIEPARRRYAVREQEPLAELFGEPERWAQTVRRMLWTHAHVIVPPFVGETSVELSVPCTFDFNVAATKYFAALEDGEVPLDLLFSGTVFYRNEDGALQVAQIPWEKEARFLLPVRIWREMMEAYYPNSAWVCLGRDVFDRLRRYKARRGLATWEQTIESLLAQTEEEDGVGESFVTEEARAEDGNGEAVH